MHILITYSWSRLCNGLVWISNKCACTYFLTVQTYQPVKTPGRAARQVDRTEEGAPPKSSRPGEMLWLGREQTQVSGKAKPDLWGKRKTGNDFSCRISRDWCLAFVNSQVHEHPYWNRQWKRAINPEDIQGYTTCPHIKGSLCADVSSLVVCKQWLDSQGLKCVTKNSFLPFKQIDFFFFFKKTNNSWVSCLEATVYFRTGYR